MDQILAVKNLRKYYGKNKGVEDVSFSIHEGEVFGFIGPNGAGKSTTIRCVMNLVNKNEGEILFLGEPLTKDRSDLYQQIGYLPSENDLYENMKVEELLKYNASFYSFDTMTKAYELVKKLHVDLNKKMNELSLGNIKKVGIIVSLMHHPKLVIMDEATSGLDPLIQEEVYEIIQEEKKKGTTFLFSSHHLAEVKRICDVVGIIKDGAIIKLSPIHELLSSSIYKIKVVGDKIINEKITPVYIGDESVYLYQEDIQGLIQILSHYHFDKLLIEEPSLEEIFMHYYK